LGEDAVDWHKQAGHVAEALAVYAAELRPYQIDTALIFHRNVERLGKAQDAADEWLTDPEQPEKYYLGSRAAEVDVVYLDFQDRTNSGEPRRKRESLQTLLQRIEAPATVSVVQIRERFSDPRDYLLKSSEQLRGELTLFMQSLALMEEKRARELAEQRAHAQEQASVAEMFEQRRELLVEELAAGLVAEGADLERAREAAERLADRALPALAASFQDEG